MENQKLSVGGESEGDGHTPDSKPADEANNHQENHLPPANVNRIRKFGVLAVEIILASSVATGFWLLGERLVVHGNIIIGGLFNYIADCLYFATAPLAVLKIWSKPIPVWGIYVLCCVALAVVFVVSYQPLIPEVPPTFPTVVAVQQPDYIEGTLVTHKQLKQFFPYGYTIFFFGENERFRYEVFTNGLLDWTIDWDKVKIDPDISAGKVAWTIPPISATGPHVNMKFINSPIHGTTSFKKEIVRARGMFLGPNDPLPYVGILSDDQRHPVFVIGFRIPSGQIEQPVYLQ